MIRLKRWWWVSILLFLLAYVAIGFRWFFPFHPWVSMGFLLAALLVFLKCFFNDFKSTFVRLMPLWVGMFLVFFFSTMYAIFPFGNAFQGMDEAYLQELIEEDLERAVIALDHLRVTGDDLVNYLAEMDVDSRFAKIVLKEKWDVFLLAAAESEQLTEFYKYFYRLEGDDRDRAFMISYALYVNKYQIFQQIIDGVDEYPLKTVLDERVEFLDDEKMYSRIVGNFYSLKSSLRLSTGRAYYAFSEGFEDDFAYSVLKNSAGESYAYLFDSFDLTLLNYSKSLEVAVDDRLFDRWFPFQKGVTNLIDDVSVLERGDLISVEDLQKMERSLEPGDLMLQRRNWYLTNVGVPGFWTHSAIYMGDLELQEEYFLEEFPYQSYENYREFLEGEYPEVFAQILTNDADGFEFSVIEALAEGVVLNSMEYSGFDADFVAAFRPKLSRLDKLKALDRAFANFAKPYDYNLDFDSLDSLVCSELIYDAYLSLDDKKGLNFVENRVRGRGIVTPTDLLQKYQDDLLSGERELDFVYFLKGDEKSGDAYVSNERALLKTLDWPKFSLR